MKKISKNLKLVIVAASLVFASLLVLADKIIVPYYHMWQVERTMLMFREIAATDSNNPHAVGYPLSEDQSKIDSEIYELKKKFFRQD